MAIMETKMQEAARTMRIALVEDDEDSREALAFLLRDHGYDVSEYADGAVAFAALRRAPPDLILLDLRMPTMDGWQFRVQQKREPLLADTPVIALSGDKSSQAQAIDADEFLEKPIHFDRLLDTVNAVIERAAARRKRENQLALESMAVVGQFSAGVAHEINNPLSCVSTNLHVMREDLARLFQSIRASTVGEGTVRAEALRAAFDEIEAMVSDSLAGAERIRTIVKDLHMLSRVDEPQRRTVAVEPALDAALGVTHNLALGHPTVVRRYGPPSFVLATERRLNHLFVNLLANAFQSIAPGTVGEIVVETVQEDGQVIVRITDNGVGIPKEARARVFEPFFTTRGPGGGKGLGLSVCHGIVASLGGAIDLESTVGKGSTFTIALPALDDAARARRGEV